MLMALVISRMVGNYVVKCDECSSKAFLLFVSEVASTLKADLHSWFQNWADSEQT